MRDLTRKEVGDIVATAVFTAAAFGAGLLSTLLGLKMGGRQFARALRVETDSARLKGQRNPVSWVPLSKMKAELAAKDVELAALRRSYDLDTGLLKLEVRRLESLLRRYVSERRIQGESTASGPRATAAEEPGKPYRSMRLIEPEIRKEGADVSFSSLASLAGKGT